MDPQQSKYGEGTTPLSGDFPLGLGWEVGHQFSEENTASQNKVAETSGVLGKQKHVWTHCESVLNILCDWVGSFLGQHGELSHVGLAGEHGGACDVCTQLHAIRPCWIPNQLHLFLQCCQRDCV